MIAKIRHRLFTLATILSLLLFLGTSWIWVKTFPHAKASLSAGGNDVGYELICYPRVNPMYGIIFYGNDYIFYFRSRHSYQLNPTSAGDYSHTFAGFFLSRDIQMDFRQWVFEGPAWTLLLLLAILPAVYIVRIKRRKPAGCCPICGYNLTGNVSGTCPECGSKIPEKLGAAAKGQV